MTSESTFDATRDYCSRFLLRIGVTPNCNFTCQYCNPTGIKGSRDYLSDEDLVDVLGIATDLGFESVHLTGGEPLLRKGLADVLRQVGSRTGKTLEYYITTNGSLLTEQMAVDLRDGGVKRVNVSIDSTSEETFYAISGTRHLSRSVAGAEVAARTFERTKVNMVVMRTFNLIEVPDAIRYWQSRGIVLRLMELLPFSTAAQADGFFPSNHVARRELEGVLDGMGAKVQVAERGNNWACDYWQIAGLPLPVGIVHHHTRGYHCVRQRCMSVRLSPGGQLASCYTSGFPTIPIMGLPYEEKRKAFLICMGEKHDLETGAIRYPRYHIPDYEAFRAGIVGEPVEAQAD